MRRHYDREMTVWRNDSGTFELVGAVKCELQPLDDANTQDVEGAIGREWLAFADYADVRENDRAEIDGVTYRVVGVERLTWRGTDRHCELRLRQNI